MEASHYPAYRPPVMGTNGVVTSAHFLASMAGSRMLQAGGNAIDAAIATAAALNVVEPFMSGLGGDGLMLITVPGASEPIVLDYSGVAPQEATAEGFAERSTSVGPTAMLVPGAPAGWLMALERYGTLPASVVFADAIRLAEDGAPISFRNSEFFAIGRRQVGEQQDALHTFFPDGETPRPASILRQPKLAAAMRRLAEGGIGAFYGGDLGREFVAAVRAGGGLLSDDDLATYRPEWREPISTTFRDDVIYSAPRPCAGIQYLQTLKMLEHDDLYDIIHNSPDYLHLLAEVIKLAVADRIQYTMDESIGTGALLDPEYLAERRALVNMERAAFGPGERYIDADTRDPAAVQPGRLSRRNGEHTTHFAAADKHGFVVNVTQSLGAPFGSGFMAGETGIMCNNFLNWVDLDPDSPNALAPSKPMENCMAPPQIYRDGQFYFSMGTPGSWGIPQTQSQAILNVLAFGMNVQQAIDAPRFRLTSGYSLSVEGRIPGHIAGNLARRGHVVKLLEDMTWHVGGMQGIMRDPETGVLTGGADPRRDGYAIAW